MDFERTLETQRLKLLRIVAGLLVVAGFLSVGPISRAFSAWASGFIHSILSRAETAARYLVIARARSMMAGSGRNVDQSRFLEASAPTSAVDESEVSISALRKRLNALRAVLMDLPRYAARLIHRIYKELRRTDRTCRDLPCPDLRRPTWPCDGDICASRIERPPDKNLTALPF